MRNPSTVRAVLIGAFLSMLLSGPARAAEWGDVIAPMIPADDTYRAAGEDLGPTTLRVVNITPTPILATIMCVFYRPAIGPDNLAYQEFGQLLPPYTLHADTFVHPVPAYMPDGVYLMRVLVKESGTGTLLATTAYMVHIGDEEVCNGVDDDGDGVVDESSDEDEDGYTVCDGDCDDDDVDIYPGALEECDGVDNDCDGAIPADEMDLDLDGFMVCDADCDDTDELIYPGALELCDGEDNDCDGSVLADEVDLDLDGFMICKDDCDDDDPLVHPDAIEDCFDMVDNDCDGDVDGLDADCVACVDADGDGYDDIACAGLDCDDADPLVNPEAIEYCDNGIDDNCDGIDPLCPVWGALVISEIMQNPHALADVDGEWFEVTNLTGGIFDLQGLVIQDLATDYHVIDEETVVLPYGTVVLGRSGIAADVVDHAYASFQLANADDEVILTTLDGSLIDEVWYDDGLTFPDPTGASMSLDPDLVVIPGAGLAGANWCESTSLFVTGDAGTPGLTNDECP